MNAATLNVTAEAAAAAYKEYRAFRRIWDPRDVEIARIYKTIAKGKTVISVNDSIVNAGVDELGRPKLAIMRADQEAVRCNAWGSTEVIFTNENGSRAKDWHFTIPWQNRKQPSGFGHLRAMLPRIPPQHRPPKDQLHKFHILWEAEWTAVPPRDPFLLQRLAPNAWIVLAAWDLTDVEINVINGHPRN